MNFKPFFNSAILGVSDLAHQGPTLHYLILTSWKCRPFLFLSPVDFDAKAVSPLHQKHFEPPGEASLFKRPGEQGGV